MLVVGCNVEKCTCVRIQVKGCGLGTWQRDRALHWLEESWWGARGWFVEALVGGVLVEWKVHLF